MRGSFHYQSGDADATRLVATINTISEKEGSAWSKWLKACNGNGGRVRRWIPCFVFVDPAAADHDGSDFKLNMSNGTAFFETRTALLAGQKVAMVFHDPNNRKPVEFMGKVVWIGRKSLADNSNG